MSLTGTIPSILSLVLAFRTRGELSVPGARPFFCHHRLKSSETLAKLNTIFIGLVMRKCGGWKLGDRKGGKTVVRM